MLFGNPANVSYATEYPIDKIVGIYTGSYDKASQTIVLGGFYINIKFLIHLLDLFSVNYYGQLRD
jgi:hypothetical protein